MVIETAFQGAFDHHLGQLARQPALASPVQPAGAGPLGELAQQLLAGRRQLRTVLARGGSVMIGAVLVLDPPPAANRMQMAGHIAGRVDVSRAGAAQLIDQDPRSPAPRMTQ
jgi:hypothetical protein